MTNCVTNLQKKSAEYIAAMDKFNISSGELEMILHEYLNLPENAKMFQEGKLSFPPDSYIQQALYGEESIVSDINTVIIYEKVFSKPFITPDKTLAMQAANEAAKYFEEKSIKIRQTKDGQYQVLVTPPVYLGGDIRVETEIATILENAPRDEQGRLLAPNGKPSNLTGRQYAQVRTKAFIDWFGDWINDPENASKVVDENGEPLVVYHGTPYFGFSEFITQVTYFTYSKKTAERYSETDYGTTKTSGIYEVFLNIRNPHPIDKYNNLKGTVINIADVKDYDEKTILKDYDGVIATNMIVAKNPSQIKSATDNIGTFSRESNNIYYNIVRNTNPKENLLITLRQEKLIHRHDTGDRYVLTLNADIKQGSQNDIDSVTRRQLIQQATDKVYLRLESLGFPKNTINIKDTESGGTAYVDVNEDVLEQVKDAVSLGATIQDIKAIYDLADFLGEKFGVKFGGIISLKQANQMTNNANPNAFILNNTVYVVANRVTVDTVAEEFLHPFVNTLYLQSPKVFKQLYDEAVELFPNLKTQIYSNYRGRENHKFTATDLMQELVAQALSRHFREEYEQSLLDGPLTVQETLKKMDESENFFTKAWYAIKRLFKELPDKLIGEKYVFEGDDLKNFSLRQVAQLINASDSSFWTERDKITRFSLDNNVKWSKSAENNYEVSSQGDKRFSTFEFYSGAAIGADTEWEKAAKSIGIKVKNYTVQDWDNLPTTWKNILDSEYREVVNLLGRRILDAESYAGKLVRRDMMQADKADAIFAIGKIASNGYVDGGTGYATTRGILREIPVYVFDQSDKQWKVWDTKTNKFIITSEPILTHHAAVIGTRQLEESGKEAIKSVILNSISVYNLKSDKKQITEERTDNEVFFEKQSQLKSQLDEVYGLDSEFTGEEFRQIAADIIYEISDIITEVEKNPEAILKYNSVAKVENVSGSSRASILSQIGIGNILDYIKKNNFSPFNGTTGNPNIAGRKDAKKAKIISNNINAFLTQGASLLLQLEGFGITDNLTVNEDVDTETIEDLNNDNERETIQETVGSLQEHWLIENRTENTFDKASVLVKQALTQCYKLNPNGTPVISKWGIRQRMDGREAMQSVIRWTQGALTISSMIKKLEALSNKNPWVIPIIERLKDTSGKESVFQSQFFGTVSKYFQLYSVVKNEKGVYSVFEVNTHPALSDAKNNIKGLYNAGAHPLFDSNGNVNITALELLKSFSEELKKHTFNTENALHVANILSNVSSLLGYPISTESILEILDSKTFEQMTKNSLLFIVKDLETNKENNTWLPFSGKKEDKGIINNIGKFITPITDKLEDVTNTSFYDSGNIWLSYVTPSYLTKLVQKVKNLPENEYSEFIQEEYGKFELFFKNKKWYNSWLELLDNNPEARNIFAHKVQLNFAGKKYMISRGDSKAMSEAEVTLSIISEYFRENNYNTVKTLAPAWFRVPLMSNKPSLEFLRFFSYRGPDYKRRVLNGCINIFSLEISRIQTVKKRQNLYTKESPEWIENFDSKGDKFCFFDFLNDVTNDEFHNLVNSVTTHIDNNNSEENAKFELNLTKLTVLAKKLINDHIQEQFNTQYEQWNNNGVVEAAKSIQTIPENSVKEALENFFWNDFLASNNILNLTITDLAYYKNTEDVQKRLALLHAPGIRPNIEARDLRGNKVADSKTRTCYLKDVVIDGKKLKSNIIDNVRVVFNKKLSELEKGTTLYKATESTYEEIIKLFESDINVADALGYACPTSYRKKALLFGKWDPHSEEIYQKLSNGTYTFTDLLTAFQPLKPFVYTQIEHNTGIDSKEGLSNIKMGVQNKNSEYLLIMANAIIQNEDTGLPNYLRAIYEVMEESHLGTKDTQGNHIPRIDGIDTIQFESTVKTGKTGLIDITEALSTEDAKMLLEDCVYAFLDITEYQKDEMTDEDYYKWRKELITHHNYNKTFVHELNLEDYCIQQEVPEHFKDHEQLQGSQIRMIIPSDLNPDKKYTIDGEELSASEFRDVYEKTIADNIEDTIQEVIEEFGIIGKTTKEQNIALAKTLQKEILSSPRYGIDLLMSCMLDSNGDFVLPLGDPVQSKRIEQLLNSIIKNRVNKQKIAGGPVVQVTNFGTSRKLNIRFKSKDNAILLNLAEYLELGGTELEWVDYIKDNQAGIAYYECFAPAYMQSIFELFMDAKGNIDIEAIEKIDSDLLKMIGYRIPSEDKYSLAPIKIVGFMPKEAGDGIMLPYEITLITGSDRDVIVSTSII